MKEIERTERTMATMDYGIYILCGCYNPQLLTYDTPQ